MAKAILTSRIRSDYDDLREERFHFPKKRNWEKALQIVGDDIIYYEPLTSGLPDRPFCGRQAYFARASVTHIEDDPSNGEFAYLYLKGYLDFDRPVAYRELGKFYESTLEGADGTASSGRFRQSVRLIPDTEFNNIDQAGDTSDPSDDSFAAERETAHARTPSPEFAFERRVRDRKFRRRVLDAYGNRCAISGLELYNKRGSPEVVATHIWPWAMGGADVARNGLPLSGTIGWMFRNGLFTLTDDLQIIRARELPKQLEALLPYGKAFGEVIPKFRPHPTYLRFHRENIFEREAGNGIATSAWARETATI